MLKALITCNGNKTHAAKELGISRPTLYDLMKKYDISTDFLLGVGKCRKMSRRNPLHDKEIDGLRTSKVSANS